VSEYFFWKTAKKELLGLLDQRGTRFRGILLSVSGHVDSMFMADLAVRDDEVRGKLRGIVHFNFKLRAQDSQNDEELVREFAKEHGLAFACVNADISQHLSAIQERSRDIRQRWYATALAQGYIVATGHHQSDVTETILFRMARGTSCSTALGMGAVRVDGIWRPLMGAAKDDILAFSKELAVRHRYDSSNDGIEYARNRIRNLVIPELESLFQGASQRIRAFASEAADLHRFARDYVETRFCTNQKNALNISGILSYEPVLFMAITALFDRAGINVSWNREELRKVSNAIRAKYGNSGTRILRVIGERELRLDGDTLSITFAAACHFENKRRYQQCSEQFAHPNVTSFLPTESALNYLPILD
jgi:tRNA(Ile)-lysidine synthetase-like protein